MSHPHDAIRPRHRRRRQAESGGSIATGAQLSTRVLIRVPLVPVSAATPVVRGAAAIGSASALPPSPVMTVQKQLGSVAPAPTSQPLDRTYSEEKTSSQLQASLAKTHVRIDAAHFESSGPHSAAPAGLGQANHWLSGILERRSLLALALIAGAAIGVALMLHNRAPHTDRATTESDANAAHNQWKAETHNPADANANTKPVTAENQNLTAYRYQAASSPSGVIGNADQHLTGASAAAPQPITTDSPQHWNVPAESNQPAGRNASGLNVPAGANIPAKLDAQPSMAPPNTTMSKPGPDLPMAYDARRELPPSDRDSVIPGIGGHITGVAAFNGNISNPAQVPR
jgi:hypothetical protein